MEEGDHEVDKATGRPIGDHRDLTDEELVEELMVAAMARDHRRIDRFQALLAERDRRAADAPLLVVVTGSPESGTALLAGALGERLGVPVLAEDDIRAPLVDALPADLGLEPLQDAAHRVLLQLADAQLRAGIDVIAAADFGDADRELFRRLVRAHERLRLVHVHCRARNAEGLPAEVVPDIPGKRIDVDRGEADIEELARTLSYRRVKR